MKSVFLAPSEAFYPFFFSTQSLFIFPYLTWEVLPGFCSDVTDAMITLITMIMTTKFI